MATKPVVLPEPFCGETSWEDWEFHFDNVADVNGWDDEQKMKWLRVRLTGRAQKAFQRLPTESKESYQAARDALKERFEPTSRKIRYQVEFQTRRKKKAETWADFADDLKSLVDKGFPDLPEEAKEHLALQSYLQQLDQPQVAFGVRQKRPTTIDDAVSLTLEMETYMLPPTRASTISSVQQDQEQDEATTVAAVDPTEKLANLLERLVLRVEKLEQDRAPVDRPLQPVPISRKQTYRSHPQQPGRKRTFNGTCWHCQQPGHLARDCPQNHRSRSGNY